MLKLGQSKKGEKKGYRAGCPQKALSMPPTPQSVLEILLPRPLSLSLKLARMYSSLQSCQLEQSGSQAPTIITLPDSLRCKPHNSPGCLSQEQNQVTLSNPRPIWPPLQPMASVCQEEAPLVRIDAAWRHSGMTLHKL